MAVFQNASGGANNNFNAGTSGQTNEFFVPEIFSKKIQNFFRKSSVIEAITNTDYAGEISAFGDTVNIIKEPVITVAAYTRAASTSKQFLTDQELTLVIDKANSFKFIVDDIEERLSHINFASVGASSAAYTLKDTMDSEVLSAMFSGVSTSTPDHQLGGDGTGSAIANWDPILISLVRRAMPNLIAYDIAGVQPMTGPTGLIFAMRSRYTSQTGAEAMFDEADTDFSGRNAAGSSVDGYSSTAHSGTNPAVLNDSSPGTYTKGTAMTTAAAEALGDASGNAFAEMAFSIEKSTVTAKSRALKAEYTMELAQDLKAIHGLDAETELANILSAEILAEINREVVRTIYINAEKGAAVNTTNAGIFDLDTDSNGRWSVERFKGLMFQLERDAN